MIAELPEPMRIVLVLRRMRMLAARWTEPSS
jgi:hypothetical protein